MSGMQATEPADRGWRDTLGDISGAFGDLGTFLPLVIGVLAVGHLDATGVLFGFGAFALLVALVYRRPVPVQPMKAVAAIAIAGGVTSETMAASGILLGLAVLVLGLTGLIERIARWLPQSVMVGVQLGIGGHLVLVGLGLVSDAMLLGGLALVALTVLMQTPLRPVACPAVIAVAIGWGLFGGGATLPALAPGWHLPALVFPSAGVLGDAAWSVVLPQLALTLTNALIMTAAFASEYFPDARPRISIRNLSLSTGIANVLLAPFGALPMCHGAGGMVAQVKFGARTWMAPAVFGTACLGLAVVYGPDAEALLALIPLAAVGALLVIAGADLAVSKRLFDSRPSCLVVIVVTAAVSIFVNVTVGLAAGLAAEGVRGQVVRLWQRRAGS